MMDKSKTPRHDLRRYFNFVPRGFGFVHHSIAILYHQVPNLSITIRNFFVAVCSRSAPRRFVRRHAARGDEDEPHVLSRPLSIAEDPRSFNRLNFSMYQRGIDF
jgi:hypothetical protein